ncbi:MAG: hypothetical protein H6R24_624 [Proteobacteria bacterium]|nr:hypothetical protein [Pseudomonadota bacterium]
MATTLEEVWALFREVAEAQKDTAQRFQETDRKFQDTDRKFQDTDRKFQETDRKFQETTQQFQETDRLMKDTDRRLKQLNDQLGKLGNRLGEFVEGLVKPAVVRLFQARGIAVHEIYPDVEVDRGEEGIQIDLLVVNDAEAILVEVKSKLTIADVNEHLERLAKFKQMLPRYADVRAMGAVAAMVVPRDVARHAYRQGLFVLAQSGDSVIILNDAKFQPKAW